jgi:hypothetical protein
MDLRWPADRFYWAVLDTSRLPATTGARRTAQLGYLFESVLPGVPIEAVHAVYERLPGDRVLACGLPVETVAAINGTTMTLAPEALPDFIEAPVSAERLNLLSGAYAPAGVRRARRVTLVLAALSLVVVSALVVTGLERRRAALLEHAAALEAGRREVILEVTGGSSTAATAQLALQLEGRRRLLERTRTIPGGASASIGAGDSQRGDADHALERLIAAWPTSATVRCRSIEIDESTISVVVLLNAMADEEVVRDALAETPGWTLTQPTVERRGAEIIATLRLERAVEENAP